MRSSKQKEKIARERRFERKIRREKDRLEEKKIIENVYDSKQLLRPNEVGRKRIL